MKIHRCNRVQSLLRILMLLLIMSAAFTPLFGSEFESLLRKPQLLDGVRVTLIGVVVGDGPEFELYENAVAARQGRNPATSLLIVADEKWRPSSTYDMRKVRITGRVNAKEHGFWGHPCVISLEKIQVLSEPLSTPETASAILKNENSFTVIVHLKGNREKAILSISPHNLVETDLVNCQVRVFTSQGILLFTEKMISQKQSTFYDSKNGDFYYRINGKKLDKVLPYEAKAWRKQSVLSRF